jgi:polysaccharide export outer membrane protein
VVDLPGVRSGLPTGAPALASDFVSSVSVTPRDDGTGSRVVVALKQPTSTRLVQEGESLLIFMESTTVAAKPPPAAAPPNTGKPLSAPLAAGIAGSAAPAQVGSPAPIPRADYIIGREDLLEIGVFEQPDLTRTVRVSGDGTISLPLLGVIPLEGLSTNEAEKKLRELLSDKYLTDPQVWVFVKEAKSKKISVVGAVKQPGTIEMLGNRSLLEAISEAGGLTDQAGQELYVLRPDPSGATTRLDVDLDDLMINGNPELNIPIRPGDVIHVPIDRILRVYVDGAVRKPGEVEYKASRPLNLVQAIAAAGGLSERASQKGILVIRTRPGGVQERIEVDLKAVRKGKQVNLPLESGDSIYVPETFF